MLKRLSLLFVLLTMQAPLVPATAADSDKLANIHTIAVISAIGHEIHLPSVNLSLFSSSDETIKADDWGFDDLVIGDIKQRLGDRFTFKSIAYDREAFSKPDSSWWAQSNVAVKALVTALPDREGIDAFLAVVPVPNDNSMSSERYLFRGLGLYRHPFGFSDYRYFAYSFYGLVLVDTRTNKVIARGRASLGEIGFWDPNTAFVSCNASVWPESVAALTDAQRRIILGSLSGLIRASLPWALHDAGLVQEAPAAAPPPACAASAGPSSGP